MRLGSVGWGVAGALLSLTLGFALGWNRILSESVDISYHLQVMEVVRETFIVPESARAFMGEMILYPKVSHRFAGFLAELGVSELNALAVAACIAAAAAWLGLLELARRVSPAVLLGTVVLTLVNIFTVQAVLGAEVIRNFFYSHMAGETVMTLGLLGGLAIRARSRLAFLAYAAAAVVFCNFFHLVPTLKLAAAFMALLGFDVLLAVLARRRLDLVGVGGIVLLFAAVVANPFFWTMRYLAANNGSVMFAKVVPMGGFVAASLLLLALSAWTLFIDLRRSLAAPDAAPDRATLAARTLAGLGAATAALVIAQLAAWELLGEGSPYAIHKHGYGLFTMLGVMIPVAVWTLKRKPGGETAPGLLRSPALVGAAQVLIMACLFLKPSVLDVPEMSEALETAREVREIRGIRPGHEDALFVSADLPPVISYMANIAMLRVPRSSNVLAILFSGDPIAPEQEKLLVTEADDPTYGADRCQIGPPIGELVVAQASCAAPPRVFFRAGAGGPPYLREGWSGPEGGGVWSMSKRAVVELPLPELRPGGQAPKLQISTSAFLPEQSPARSVRATIEGGESEAFTYGRTTNLGHVFVLTLPPSAIQAKRARIVFDIPDAVSPKALGLGEDTRELGVTLESIRLLPRSAGTLAGEG